MLIDILAWQVQIGLIGKTTKSSEAVPIAGIINK